MMAASAAAHDEHQNGQHKAHKNNMSYGTEGI